MIKKQNHYSFGPGLLACFSGSMLVVKVNSPSPLSFKVFHNVFYCLLITECKSFNLYFRLPVCRLRLGIKTKIRVGSKVKASVKIRAN